MTFGPFDSDEPAAEADHATLEPSAAFGDTDVQKMLAEAGRTWDALTSDLQSDWKARN